MKLQSFWGRPINDNYDSHKMRDGGGYWQFDGGAVFTNKTGLPIVVNVCDTSCGWFGTRKAITVEAGRQNFTVYWGTMYEPWYVQPTCRDLYPMCKAASITIGEAREAIEQAFEAANIAAYREYRQSVSNEM